MTNEVAWLRAMASVLRRLAHKRTELGDLELGSELRGLAIFTDCAAVLVQEHDERRAAEVTAPAARLPQPILRERTQPGIAAPTSKGR